MFRHFQAAEFKFESKFEPLQVIWQSPDWGKQVWWLGFYSRTVLKHCCQCIDKPFYIAASL